MDSTSPSQSSCQKYEFSNANPAVRTMVENQLEFGAASATNCTTSKSFTLEPMDAGNLKYSRMKISDGVPGNWLAGLLSIYLVYR